jgi:hypothetical protein
MLSFFGCAERTKVLAPSNVRVYAFIQKAAGSASVHGALSLNELRGQFLN